MDTSIGNIVVLKRAGSIYELGDFIGRVKDVVRMTRLILVPLSEKHELYNTLTKDYIENECGFPSTIYVHEVKTSLIQLLLEGCVYEI